MDVMAISITEDDAACKSWARILVPANCINVASRRQNSTMLTSFFTESMSQVTPCSILPQKKSEICLLLFTLVISRASDANFSDAAGAVSALKLLEALAVVENSMRLAPERRSCE